MDFKIIEVIIDGETGDQILLEVREMEEEEYNNLEEFSGW